MLRDAKQQLEDHTSGRRLLDDDERTRVEKKVDIFQRKLDTMSEELSDFEIERMLKREEIRNERMRDRLARREEL